MPMWQRIIMAILSPFRQIISALWGGLMTWMRQPRVAVTIIGAVTFYFMLVYNPARLEGLVVAGFFIMLPVLVLRHFYRTIFPPKKKS